MTHTTEIRTSETRTTDTADVTGTAGTTHSAARTVSADDLSTTSAVPPAVVVACAAYVVTEVGGLLPTALEEFAGLTDFVVEGLTGTNHVTCQGGEGTDGTVRFYEKDNHGTGKDVRVWTVSRRDAGFLATC